MARRDNRMSKYQVNHNYLGRNQTTLLTNFPLKFSAQKVANQLNKRKRGTNARVSRVKGSG